MQFISLREAIARGDTPEANHRPNILRELPNGIGGKLMELHLQFQQYIREDWVQGHPQTSSKLLIKHNSLVAISQIRLMVIVEGPK
jgi:hypothetical protein